MLSETGSVHGVLRRYPHLTHQEVETALAYAAELLDFEA